MHGRVTECLKKKNFEISPPVKGGAEGGGFARMTHRDAMNIYGSDKPDLRFDCNFEDFSETFMQSFL